MYRTARFWNLDDRGRIVCSLCPRGCRLEEGERGYCYVRRAEAGHLKTESYGHVCSIALDPMEKKPLYHFLPGTKILSFGTRGCNMGCSFCQNWHLSKPGDHLAAVQPANAAAIVSAAHASGCGSIAFTYNDPVVFSEFAMDVARLAHDGGLKTVAVTAGYISPEARSEFFAHMDAANVDLKSFSSAFYRKHCAADLDVILDTLRYIAKETHVWLEITNLLIPWENDSPEEIAALSGFIARELGTSIPLHFSAFHPDFCMTEKASTPTITLLNAQKTAHEVGLEYVYLGNIRERDNHTLCRQCQATLIERRGYDTKVKGLDRLGRCLGCKSNLPGIFK